jgi:hypothetical protein
MEGWCPVAVVGQKLPDRFEVGLVDLEPHSPDSGRTPGVYLSDVLILKHCMEARCFQPEPQKVGIICPPKGGDCLHEKCIEVHAFRNVSGLFKTRKISKDEAVFMRARV